MYWLQFSEISNGWNLYRWQGFLCCHCDTFYCDKDSALALAKAKLALLD